MLARWSNHKPIKLVEGDTDQPDQQVAPKWVKRSINGVLPDTALFGEYYHLFQISMANNKEAPCWSIVSMRGGWHWAAWQHWEWEGGWWWLLVAVWVVWIQPAVRDSSPGRNHLATRQWPTSLCSSPGLCSHSTLLVFRSFMLLVIGNLVDLAFHNLHKYGSFLFTLHDFDIVSRTAGKFESLLFYIIASGWNCDTFLAGNLSSGPDNPQKEDKMKFLSTIATILFCFFTIGSTAPQHARGTVLRPWHSTCVDSTLHWRLTKQSHLSMENSWMYSVGF